MPRITQSTLLHAIIWIPILGLSAYFFFANVIAYWGGYRNPRIGDSLLSNQLWFALHITGASLVLWLGPSQFWPGVRRRFVRFHRFAGRAIVAGSLAAAVSAMVLSTANPCVGCGASLFTLSVTWFCFVCIGFVAAWQRKFLVNREFMIRSYTCALAFVFVRVIGELPGSWWQAFAKVPEVQYTTMEWLGWVAPLMFVEVIFIGLPKVWSKGDNGTGAQSSAASIIAAPR